ncbi:hypothetical protein ACOMHN_058774 [Nucella lapillus]
MVPKGLGDTVKVPKRLAVTWLSLSLLSITIHIPPMHASHAASQQAGMYRPSPLDGCKNLAEWKAFYGLCVRLMPGTTTSPGWMDGDQPSMPASLAQPVFPQYQGPGSAEGSDGDATQDLSDFNFGDNLVENDDDFMRLKKQDWLPALQTRGVLRTRRQHSLSINSALVSLADMLIAKDYNRKQARQKDFRQQLLGLGR